MEIGNRKSETVLLLHGAIGAKDQLELLAVGLKESYIVHSINFTGHGGEPIPIAPFSMELFARQVLDYLDENKIISTHIFGYSMGGYVGMLLAKNHPEKVNSLITLATKFYWDNAVAAKEIKMLDAATIREKIPAFAQQLQQRHHPQDWEMVLEKTRELLKDLGMDNPLRLSDYPAITTSCLILLGDRDKMISLEETIAVYKQLPSAQMAMLPGTPHPIEQVNIDVLVFLMNRFLQRVDRVKG